MKKAFTLVVLMVTPTMAFAQGTVGFANGTGIVRWPGMSLPVGGGCVELIAAPTGTALANPLFTYDSCGLGSLNFSSLEGFLAANPGWQSVATVWFTAPVAGRFNGGTVTIPNIAPGANAEYFLIGWTGSSVTWDAAVWSGALLGESAIFTTATGNPLAYPPVSPVSLAATFAGMTLGWDCLGCFNGFTAEPTNQTAVLGATATLYVRAIACPPPYYQWYFNGVSIPGATDSSFQISNAQVTNAGTYWVVLSNTAWGVRASGSATLTVRAEPIITSPPQSQTAYVGSTVNFRASAGGSLPFAYQWYFNGSAISGAGSSDLRLTSVSATQAGTYTLVVTNVVGAVTSAPAMLSVIPPVERRMVPVIALLGQPGSLLHLDDADALGPSPGWATFSSVTLTNSSQLYFDVSTPLPPQRFYRAWQTGGQSVLPSLDLKRAPALTVTGPIGSSVRVDYINQFGPTDAWVALDTVMLTNAAQLYFDVSTPGQPPRLYRLVQVP